MMSAHKSLRLKQSSDACASPIQDLLIVMRLVDATGKHSAALWTYEAADIISLFCDLKN